MKTEVQNDWSQKILGCLLDEVIQSQYVVHELQYYNDYPKGDAGLTVGDS